MDLRFGAFFSYGLLGEAAVEAVVEEKMSGVEGVETFPYKERTFSDSKQ
jgi:hypothetical protein